MKKKILVVDDELDILNLVKYNLLKEGFQVTCVESGEKALESVKSDLPNLILLDIMLPGIDGIEVCRILKQDINTENIPIIMLSAKEGESDIIAGLEMGADDYITKPFSLRILIAQIKAGLRRKNQTTIINNHQTVQINNILIDPGKHKVFIEGKELILTYSEFKLLQLFTQKPGLVFTRIKMVDVLHGQDYFVSKRAIDVQIVGLRKKLGNYGKMIETVRGVGYRFNEHTNVNKN